MRALIDRVYQALCLLVMAFLLASCGGGGGGTSSGGGFSGTDDTLQITIQVASTTVPANLNNFPPDLTLPFTTSVLVRVEPKRSGGPAPTTPFDVSLQVQGVEHGAVSRLDDPETADEDEFLALKGTDVIEDVTVGAYQFFFTSFSVPGVSTLVATVVDPVSRRLLSAQTTITVTPIARQPTSLTFTGAFINAVLARQTMFGDIAVQDGNYQRVLGVLATDASGNPVNPATQINFFLIDAPITGYPQSGSGAFFIAGPDGDPLEGDFRFDAASGQFVTKGARRFDRLVLDGRQTNPPDQPLPDNNFLTGIRVIDQVLNQTTLFVQRQDPPFAAGFDNGPTVPYIVGRAQHGTIISPAFTDTDGVADTTLTYPVSRLGQTAILVACTNDFSVCTVLNTCDRTGANCGPVYLGVTNGLNRELTVSDTSIPPNRSEPVTLCLRDPNLTPLPGETITYVIGPTGPAQVTINGNPAQSGTLRVGADGCITVTIASSGLVPGVLAEGIQIAFNSANRPANQPVIVTIQPVTGTLVCVERCTVDATTSRGLCTVITSLIDQFGSGIPNASIGVSVDGPTGGATVTFNPAQGAFGLTDNTGSTTATIGLAAVGSFTFTFSTVPGGAATCTVGPVEVPEPPEPPGGEVGQLAIDTGTLPDGVAGQPYLALLEASGTETGSVLQWSIQAGQLPPGLSLNAATGVISGTPTTQGTFSFILRVADTAGLAGPAAKLFTITITGSGGGQLVIDTDTLPDGVVGQPYLTLLEASGVETGSVLQWSIQSGQLPPGLSLNAATGVISGTPTTQGTFSFILRVEDTRNLAAPATKLLTITITGSGGGPTPGNPAQLGLATDKPAVQSNNSDAAMITATVLDAQNVGIPNVTVTFSATGGQLSASQVTTDENGNATVEFRSGTVNSANQVVTITATVGSLTRSIPIQIVGTALTLEVDTTSLPADGTQTALITVTLRNAGGIPLFDRPVCFEEQSTAGGDLALLDVNSNPLSQTPCPTAGVTGALGGRTDVNGQLRIRVRGVSAGQVNLIVRAEGAQANQNFTISAVGQVFQILQPADDAPAQLINTGGFDFLVNAPGATAVVFATSLGVWQDSGDGSCQPPFGQSVITCNVNNGQARARLTSTIAGTANVVVRDRDQPDRTDNVQVQFTANICDATQLQLEATPSVVPVSTGGVQNVSTLIATLLTNQDQPVANAVVSFTLLQSTGGGEIISPPTAVTDNTGEARTTFVSGARGTGGQGITIQARVVKPSNCPGELTDTFNIVITEEAGSITIGTSTTIFSVNGDTAYRLPMSVLLADVNGNPVRNATVNLSAWPVFYSTGFRVTDPEPGVVITDTFPNEDVNENTILEPGEDINNDGQLTPPNSAAGALPSTVTTDQSGVATFDLIYLKQYADWIVVRVRASALVSGTEVVSELVFRLPGEAGEETADPPVLPNSPFNPTCPYTLSAPAVVSVPSGGTTPVTFILGNSPAPLASVAGRPVQVVAVSGVTTISASEGFTSGSGLFTSSIAAAQGTPAGSTAIITFFGSCVRRDITVQVVSPPP